MSDIIIVGLIVAAAIFFMGRFLYQSLSGRTSCNCNSDCCLQNRCNLAPGANNHPKGGGVH